MLLEISIATEGFFKTKSVYVHKWKENDESSYEFLSKKSQLSRSANSFQGIKSTIL